MWILLLQSCIYSYKLELTFTSDILIIVDGLKLILSGILSLVFMSGRTMP